MLRDGVGVGWGGRGGGRSCPQGPVKYPLQIELPTPRYIFIFIVFVLPVVAPARVHSASLPSNQWDNYTRRQRHTTSRSVSSEGNSYSLLCL